MPYPLSLGGCAGIALNERFTPNCRRGLDAYVGWSIPLREGNLSWISRAPPS